MLIEETFTIDAPKAEVARFLLDVDRMGACVPGVEGLKRLDQDRYEASLSVRMGPIQANFKGNVVIDAKRAPDTIVATADGRDAATGSVAQVKFSADLIESEAGVTSILSVSDVTIRGRLGQFGSGVVSATAREMVKSFAQCAGHHIGATKTSDGAQPPDPPGLASIVLRGILGWLKELWARVRGTGHGESALMVRFVEPGGLAEACALVAEDEWGNKFIAGGTALVLMMRQGLIAPSTLVSIGRIPGIDGISADDSLLAIGARATHKAVSTSPEVMRWAPALARACGLVGNERIRNVGTLGGNLAEADYAADPPTVLVGLDAICHVTGPRGSRDLPVEELATGFYSTSLASGEIITSVSVPIGADRESAYEKFVSRSSEDRPCVGVFATARYEGTEVTQIRVVVGAAVAVPQSFDEITSQQSEAPSTMPRDERFPQPSVMPSNRSKTPAAAAGTAARVTTVLVRRALERVTR